MWNCSRPDVCNNLHKQVAIFGLGMGRDKRIRVHMEKSASHAKTSATEGGDVQRCGERAEERTNQHDSESSTAAKTMSLLMERRRDLFRGERTTR